MNVVPICICYPQEFHLYNMQEMLHLLGIYILLVSCSSAKLLEVFADLQHLSRSHTLLKCFLTQTAALVFK